MTYGRPQTAKPCQQCQALFLGTATRKYCAACRLARIATCKATSQRERTVKRAARECYDLSPGEIDRKFTEALAVIRQARAHSSDEIWSHSWKYQEPGK